MGLSVQFSIVSLIVFLINSLGYLLRWNIIYLLNTGVPQSVLRSRNRVGMHDVRPSVRQFLFCACLFWVYHHINMLVHGCFSRRNQQMSVSHLLLNTLVNLMSPNRLVIIFYLFNRRKFDNNQISNLISLIKYVAMQSF